MCKGLRGNSEAVHEHMFNVNVRINRLKAEGVEDVNEVGTTYILIKLVHCQTCLLNLTMLAANKCPF